MKNYFNTLNVEVTAGNMTQKQAVSEVVTIKCALEESKLFREWSELGAARRVLNELTYLQKTDRRHVSPKV